jgi:hypothetical protein
MKEFDFEKYNNTVSGAANNNDNRQQKPKQSILWLNASNISEEDFEDMVSMLSNYDGNLTCAIVRDKKKYKLPNGVNYCRGLLAELSAYIGEKDIKLVE